MTSAISEIRASGGVLRAAWILAAFLAGAGIALLIARGDVWAALMALAGALVLWVATRALARNGEWAALGAVVALAYGGRLALLVTLHDVLAALGKGGHLFGDDAEYEALALRMADYFHGAHDAVAWYGDAYLMGAFVYLQAGLFTFFGDQVTIVKVLNAVFAAGLVALLYDTTKRHFGRAAGLVAAVLGGAFPSLVLWSVLDLKDALALLLLGLILWSAGRVSRPRSWWRPFVIVVVSLALLASVRLYLFLTVAVLLPLAFAVTPGRPMIPWGRRAAAAVAAGMMGLALWTASINGWLGPAWAADPQVRSAFVQAGLLSTSFEPPRLPTTLDVIERQRNYAAIGARTAYADAAIGEKPLLVKPGERFVIEPPPSSAAPSVPVTASLEPRVVVVAPGSQIVLVSAAPSDAPTPTPPPSGTVVVRPGDVVQIAGAAPNDAAKPLQLQADTDRPIDVVEQGSIQANLAVAGRLFAYLPRGLLYALLAPFPWQAQTLSDLATIPEMLAWYVVLAAALVALWRHRARWRELFLVAATFGAILLVLAFAEGNTGTLFRHRAMLMPFTFILAAPTLFAWSQALATYRRRR